MSHLAPFAAVPLAILLGYVILEFDGLLALTVDGDTKWWLSLPVGILVVAIAIAGGGAVPYAFATAFPWYVRSFEQRRRQKIRDRRAMELLSAPDTVPVAPFCLYLRPFQSTGRLRVLVGTKEEYDRRSQYVRGKGPSIFIEYRWSDLETLMAAEIELVEPLVALGHPGEGTGAGRVPVEDAGWRAAFTKLARHAKHIVVVPSTHEGTLWEIREILRERVLWQKTTIIVPPRTFPSNLRGGVAISNRFFPGATRHDNPLLAGDIADDARKALRLVGLLPSAIEPASATALAAENMGLLFVLVERGGAVGPGALVPVWDGFTTINLWRICADKMLRF